MTIKNGQSRDALDQDTERRQKEKKKINAQDAFLEEPSSGSKSKE